MYRKQIGFGATGLALLALFFMAGDVVTSRADDDRVVVRDGSRIVISDGTTVSNSAYLGVQLEEETEHAEGGARITSVVDDSPAETAGLKEGDIVVGFDGKTIRGPVGLTKQIHGLEPGDTVSLQVIRDGREQTIDVELGKRRGLLVLGDNTFVLPDMKGMSIELDDLREQLGEMYVCADDDEDCSFNFDFQGFDGDWPESIRPFAPCDGDGDCSWSYSVSTRRPLLGIQLVDTTEELRRHLGGTEDAGALISKIVSGSPAEHAGIQVGDLMLSIDGNEVRGARDIRAALHDRYGETVDIELVRDGQVQHVDVTLPERDDDRPTGPRALYRVFPAPPAAPTAPTPPAPPTLPTRLHTDRGVLRELARAEQRNHRDALRQLRLQARRSLLSGVV